MRTENGLLVGRIGGPAGIMLALDLPAGSVIKRIDAISYVQELASSQIVVLYERDLVSETTQTSIASVAINPAPETSLRVGQLVVDHPVVASRQLSVFHSNTALGASPAAWNAVAGLHVHYVPPARSFVPVAPFRVFDSRWDGFGGRFAGGTSRVVSVADARTSTGAIAQVNAVPAGAVAITFNVTVAGTQGGAGLLSVTPASSTSFTTSTINWSGDGVLLANGSTVSLSGNRQVRIHCAGNTSTNAIVDVTGFYI